MAKRQFMLSMATLGLAAATFTLPGLAQSYPAKAVRIIVAGSAGSSMDLSARAMADHFAKSWGVPAIVETRAGANSVIGADAVAKSAPDGYTILYVLTTFIQAPHLMREMPYDVFKSFAPVAQSVSAPLWLTVNAEIAASTPREFVALAKASPEKFGYTSPGTGSTPHLYGHVLARVAGVDLLHVPHKGLPPAVLDVVTGRAASVFANYADVSRQVDAGKLKILGTTGTVRSKITPNVPTMLESGLAGFETSSFGGFLAPAGTPRPIVDRLARSVADSVADKAVADRLNSMGYEPSPSSPEAFAALLKSQFDTWRRVIESAGVKPE